MNIVKRNAVKIIGKGDKLLVLAHGYGCSQKMWDELIPYLVDEYKLLLFDHVGSGESDVGEYNKTKYSSLMGYATDLLEIIEHFEIEDICFVGHSVSASIGLIAAQLRPEIFSRLILVSPSPCFINKEGYEGGFEASTIEAIIQNLNANFDDWARTIAPVLTGQNDTQSDKLIQSFCSTKPEIAKHFAHVTFTSDCREILPSIKPQTHILQCLRDNLAPVSVGQFMATKIKDSHYHSIDASGHCPHLTHPQEVAKIIRSVV